MRRREFITLLGGAALVSPLAARAQQSRIPVVGFVSTVAENAFVLRPFRQGLKEGGYVEGENVAIEYHWAGGQLERLPALVADLVRRQVDVIVTHGGVGAARRAKSATSTVPIVFAIGVDPVTYGLVPSLNRPGGNLTGVTFFNDRLGAKRLELLHELVPEATTVGYLTGGANLASFQNQKNDMLEAARALRREVLILECRSRDDIEAAFTSLVQRSAGALIVGAFPILFVNNDLISALAWRHKMPAIYPYFSFGNLMSYGSDPLESHQQAGIYVGKILKGAKPADLPIRQPTKFEFVINLKVAKELGISVPRTLLARASRVIELSD